MECDTTFFFFHSIFPAWKGFVYSETLKPLPAGVYLLAKFEAHADRKIYRANHYIISGHSLGHLCLAVIPVLLSTMLIYRNTKCQRYCISRSKLILHCLFDIALRKGRSVLILEVCFSGLDYRLGDLKERPWSRQDTITDIFMLLNESSELKVGRVILLESSKSKTVCFLEKLKKPFSASVHKIESLTWKKHKKLLLLNFVIIGFVFVASRNCNFFCV